MQIDWITVAAQIVNFLVLVYLLKRFLYQPVLQAMARRESGIRERLDEARQREREAEASIREHESRLQELDEQRAGLLEEAEQEADRRRKALLDEAREEVAETRRRWQLEARREQEEFLRELRDELADLLRSVSARALAGLADARLETQIVEVFLERLKSLDEDTRGRLAGTGGPLAVTTSFPVDSATRGRITRAVHDHVAAEADVEYRESDELICGLELAAGGCRLGWSLADYLQQFGERITDKLAELPADRD